MYCRSKWVRLKHDVSIISLFIGCSLRSILFLDDETQGPNATIHNFFAQNMAAHSHTILHTSLPAKCKNSIHYFTPLFLKVSGILEALFPRFTMLKNGSNLAKNET